MKRLFSFMVAGAVLVGGSSVFGGSACCASGKVSAEAKEAKAGGCGDLLSKLNLTEQQKTKIAELKATCDKEGCTQETHAKFMKGLKEILTAEQIAQCKAECAKTAKGGCPMAQDESKI